LFGGGLLFLSRLVTSEQFNHHFPVKIPTNLIIRYYADTPVKWVKTGTKYCPQTQPITPSAKALVPFNFKQGKNQSGLLELKIGFSQVHESKS
jgi:hypothetical protein